MKKILLIAAALSVCTVMSAQKKAHWGVEVGYDHSWLTQEQWADSQPQYSEKYGCPSNGFHVGPTMTYDFLTGHKHVPSISVGLFYQFMGSEYPLGMTGAEYKKLVNDTKIALEQAGGKNPNVSMALYSHAIQIPVNARYTFRPNNKFDLFVHTGPMLNIYAARYMKESAYAFVDGKKTGVQTQMSMLSNKATTTVWTLGEKSVEDISDPEDTKVSNVTSLYWNVGVGVTLFQHFSIALGYDQCIGNQSFVTKVGGINKSMTDCFLKLNLGYSF